MTVPLLRKKRRMLYFGIALGVALLVVLALAGLSLVYQNQSPPGVVDDSLADCPDSPNCVCSISSSDDHKIEPLKFSGEAETAMKQMLQVLSELPRSEVITRQDKYAHVVVRSALFRFPDDVEILLDAEHKQFQIRSASRAGKSDLGVNRKRVETIREQFQQLNAQGDET